MDSDLSRKPNPNPSPNPRASTTVPTATAATLVVGGIIGKSTLSMICERIC